MSEQAWIGPLTLSIEPHRGPHQIICQTGSMLADGPYAYQLRLNGQEAPLLEPEGGWEIDLTQGDLCTLSGELCDPETGAPLLFLRHALSWSSEQRSLVERIEMTNRSERRLKLADVRLGFRCHFPEGAQFKAIAVPFGYPDKAVNITAPFPSRTTNPPLHLSAKELAMLATEPLGAEGWVLLQPEGAGWLIAKHAAHWVEHSLLLLDRFDQRPWLLLGGGGFFRGDPEELADLEPGAMVAMGETYLIPFEGDWREGFYRFRELMSSLGHAIPAAYDPPVHWNQLYNNGCRDYPSILPQPYDLEDLLAEAQIAHDLGCEALYLDPGWDASEGSSRWDDSRLGAFSDFVRRMEQDFGLRVALHTIGHVRDPREFPGCQWQDSRGDFVMGSWEYFMCFACPDWQHEKARRLIDLARDGAAFFMFDGIAYQVDPEGQPRPCHVADHGHPVPLRRVDHARGLLEVARRVKQACPEVLIEVHETIGGGWAHYHPVYFGHAPDVFDERWGFENMVDPLREVLEGKGLTLYYYNLAYELPLYLHIDLGSDTETMLAFWYYASLVRHLGIGGIRRGDPNYEPAKAAMGRYRTLKDVFVYGQFYGIAPEIHLHVLPQGSRAVVAAFNFEPLTRVKWARIPLTRLALPNGIAGTNPPVEVEVTGGHAELTLSVPAMSPLIVELIGA